MAGVAKFLLGFTLAIAILFFSGVTAARYLITRLTAPPPRPVFPNDNPMPASPEASPAAEAAPSPAPSPEAAASPTPEPSPSPTGTVARVTQPIGLILRSEASQASEQVGGIEYNAEVEILETSPDGEWLRVRVPGSEQEGWIKSGNTAPP